MGAGGEEWGVGVVEGMVGRVGEGERVRRGWVRGICGFLVILLGWAWFACVVVGVWLYDR